MTLDQGLFLLILGGGVCAALLHLAFLAFAVIGIGLTVTGLLRRKPRKRQPFVSRNRRGSVQQPYTECGIISKSVRAPAITRILTLKC